MKQMIQKYLEVNKIHNIKTLRISENATPSSQVMMKNKSIVFEDIVALQTDLIRILEGVSGASDKADFATDSISTEKCFAALKRISSDCIQLRYYFNIIYKVLYRNVFCKGFEIPEVLFEQMRARGGAHDVEVNKNITYQRIKDECLIALNQIIRKAQKIERDSLNEIEELKAQIKVKDLQLTQIQSEFENFKNLSTGSVLHHKFIEVSEKAAQLTKENHLLFYKHEISKEEVNRLDIKLAVKQDELHTTKEEVRALQNEIMNWESKFNKLQAKFQNS